MAGGGFATATANGVEFEAKITPIVIISCIMAATGGLMFGYDVGVSGGVTSMPDFLKKFFPVVHRKVEAGADKNSNYCKYDNQGLQLFTSSLYLAGLTATFFASYTTRTLGRRPTMLIAGVFFIIGVVLNAAAQDLAMLIAGRILLGCGVGFANQAVPLFLSEIAPTKIRGGLNILFQLNVTIGILFANLVNYGTAKIKGGWGWRLSLGLAGVPALLLTVGALLVTETPNSLVERGRLDEGKAVLRRIRGTDNVEPEFADLLEASRLAKEVKHPFRNLLQRRNRPQLIIAVALQIFQQCTGINAIMFYAPVLFSTLGFGNDAALYSAVVTGAVNVLSTVVSIYSVDKVGRRVLLLEAAGVFFIIGVVLNAAAQDLAMLIAGRILLGCGVGFANQAVPLFLSEIAPTKIRGGLNILFQLNVTIGILFANLVNYGTAKIKGGWGWRLSLGLAGVPALLLTVGALLVTETPNSLVERGRLDEGKAVLRRIRGTDNVEPEFADLLEASRLAKEVKHPFRNLLQRRNRPQLVIAVALQIFQQCTGINAIMFYAPVLFSTLGFGNDAALYSAVVTGAVNVLSTVVSIYSVDKVGRRVLLLEAGVQMFFSQVVIAIILGIKVTDHSQNLSKGFAILVVVMICTYVAAFAWSWGPLGWLIPSETFPLETRSAGQSVTVCVNLLFTFIIAQAFLSMLCHFKFGIFIFFSSWVLVMSFFVMFLLPETKNIPIEEMTERVWKKHWFWARFMDDHHDDQVFASGHVNGKKSNGKSNGFDPSTRL
ncbi:hypothetical protein F2Q70_00000373 [Brassica cretica]|uniref:Major facilitator superfamily (MFS) profile domain-containing protein n=1 Tax=Brassica cretica TaxID=69181 RepID=A0A8S9J1C7_BRACR|nr:hypothetical protein F2Q70_00000373 [Brassica cretica]